MACTVVARRDAVLVRTECGFALELLIDLPDESVVRAVDFERDAPWGLMHG